MGVRVRARVVCVSALEFEFESSRSSSRSSASELEGLRSSSSLEFECGRVRDKARVLALQIEFESRFKCGRVRDRARVKEIRVRVGAVADRTLSKTPSGTVLGEIPGPRPREHSQAPGKDLEKYQLEELDKNHRAVGNSLEKCRVGSIHTHSPTSLTLPLSSPKGDGLRNNSSSRPVRASVTAFLSFPDKSGEQPFPPV